MTIPLALFASSYNEDDANGTMIENSKSSYNPAKNNRNNFILDNNDNNNHNYKSRNSNQNLRKTIKQKSNAPNESKLAALLKSMDESSDSEDDADNKSNLATYKGSGPNDSNTSNSRMFPPLPEVNYKGSSPNNSSQKENTYTPDIPTPSSGPVTNNKYDNMPSNYANQYYKQFIPYINQSSSEIQEPPKGELMEKINYIIDMLEDQKDYKTNSIFEDLILYAFLGIFVIFIVDSFSRSGKYVR